MSFDTIITIAVIIYIIVSIRKALTAGKKGKPSPPASGWKRKLQDFVSEIKQEIEKANQEAKTSSTNEPDEIDFWDQINEEESIEEKQPAEVINQTLFYESKQTPKPPPLHIAPEEKPEEKPEESHRIIRKKPQCEEHKTKIRKRKSESALCLDKDSLKKAVIWSEILAPPVGLRD